MPANATRKAIVCWITGLSGSGKSTIANGVRCRLARESKRALVLDGDVIRAQMNRHLGFSETEIHENNRLIAEYCARVWRQYDAILVPVISPFATSRGYARNLLGDRFYEIYCAADVEVVKKRDVKGLYAKAMRGEITNLIGFSPGHRYEIPSAPDLALDTGSELPADSTDKLVSFILERL